MPAAQPQEIRLVAGLGNPGEEYENTRHNAGFRAIEELGERLGAGYWKSQCGAKVAVVRVRGQEGPREVILAMPQDFMNTSGGPISKLCREYRVAPEELLVIHDELDLDPGDVRVKVGGGHAGHNGLKSIINKLGSRDFSRIRVGIGMPRDACPSWTGCSRSTATPRWRTCGAPPSTPRTPPRCASSTASSLPATA